MTEGEIEQALRSVLTEEFKVEETKIAPEATFDTMGLDSLDIVSLVMALEDRLGVDIPETAFDGIERLGDALDLLKQKVAAGA
ncbi:MAG: acyl carrier protein [Actinomycetota bacterium]